MANKRPDAKKRDAREGKRAAQRDTASNNRTNASKSAKKKDTETQTPSCEWLVLIYMDIAGPELVEPAKAELFELLAAKFDDRNLRVIVQTTGLLLDGRNARGTRRYRVANSRLVDLSPKVTGRNFGQRAPAKDAPREPEPFAGKLNYSVSTAQSLRTLIFDALSETAVQPRRRLLILWGHGAGPGLGLERRSAPIHSDRLQGSAPPPAHWPPSSHPSQWNLKDRPLSSPLRGLLSQSQKPTDGQLSIMNGMTSTVIGEAMRDAMPKDSPDGARPEPFDLIIFDSCFLSSAEMAFQLRRMTRYFIASQGIVGFPTLDLTRLLQRVQVTGTEPSDLLDLGRAIVDQAIELDSGAVGLSLFRCKVEGEGDPPWSFMLRLRALVAVLRVAIWNPELRADIRAAFEAASWVEVRQFVDIVDLAVRLQRCREAGKSSESRMWPHDSAFYKKVRTFEDGLQEDLRKELKEAAAALENLLASPNGFLAYHQTRRVPAGQEQGMSIFVPWFRARDPRANVKVDPDLYSCLDLNRHSRWSDFIFAVSPQDINPGCTQACMDQFSAWLLQVCATGPYSALTKDQGASQGLERTKDQGTAQLLEDD